MAKLLTQVILDAIGSPMRLRVKENEASRGNLVPMDNEVSLIFAGVDGSGKRLGASLGPRLLRLANVEEAVSQYARISRICERGPSTVKATHGELTSLFSDSDLRTELEFISGQVRADIEAGCIPIVFLGDHSFSAASVGAAKQFYPDINVFWYDAHTDVHTPDTSTSKNLHGMVVSALAGIPYENKSLADYETLRTFTSPQTPTPFIYVGVRDVDPGERHNAKNCAKAVFSMENIDSHNLANTFEEFLSSLPSGTPIWISFDIDCVDSSYSSSSGTPVEDGMTPRELHTTAELLNKYWSDGHIKICGVDIVELNPMFGDSARAVNFLIHWLQTLLGRTTL